MHPINEETRDGESILLPVFRSTTYGYVNGSDLVYPGFLTSPNQLRLSRIMTDLEGGEWGLVFSSGMAAISIALLALLRSGDHIVLSKELYGGTMNLVSGELSRMGISASFADPNLQSFEKQMRRETKVIFIETPSNPLLSVLPLAEIAQLAHARGIVTVVDNTMATSINQRPLDFGIDISIQSGTKYLGGHNDLQFGTLVCKDKSASDDILRAAKLFGGALSSDHCYEAERSLKTLALRVNRHNENGIAIAEFLSTHPLVKRVYYPGLKDHPQHNLAVNQMKGFGGLVSFEIDVDQHRIDMFLKAFKIIKPALSFGGVESVICVPSKTSHRGLSEDARHRLGIKPNLVRLSAGIERVEDIIADLKDALNV